MREFSVSILEGTTDDHIATYFCEERPTFISIPIEDTPEYIVLLKFVPKNGSPMRVGRTTLVPHARVVAISGDFENRPTPEGTTADVTTREFSRRVSDRPQA